MIFIQGNITILNMYTSNNRASKYVRQNLVQLKRETDKYTIIARDFSN